MARFAGGWVKFSRKIASNDPHRNPYFGDVVSYALIHLLVEWANFSDGEDRLKRQKFKLKRGQLVTSLEELSAQFGVSKKVIRRALVGLEKGTVLGTHKGTLGTIITIYNYDKYQSQEELEGTPEGTPSGKGRARDGHYSKNNKEEEEDLKPPPPTPPQQNQVVVGLNDFQPLVSHAEAVFNCTFDSNQVSKFQKQWADNPQFSASDLRSALDWIASHPKARAETANPLLRCFFLKAVQADNRQFDKNVVSAIKGFKKWNWSDDAIIEELAKNPDYDSKVMANYVRSKL